MPTAEAVATTRRRRGGPGGWASMTVTQVILIVYALIVVLPVLWMLLSSLKTNHQFLYQPFALPTHLQFSNYARAWTADNIGRWFINSVIVVVVSTFFTVLLSSMCAYVLARYEFPGRNVIYYAFILGLSFPVILAIVPLFFIVQGLGLLGSLPGLIIVYVAYSLPFTVFFLTAFFRTLPMEIAEAGLIDGSTHFGVFFRLMLPLAMPGLVSMTIFNVLGQWNQYLLPLVLDSTNPNNYVLAQGLANLSQIESYHANYVELFAGLTIAILPIFVLYAILQNRLQAGMTAGAVK
ncbi:MAG: carbohydrate ABC transporter permease [Candidatus Dormibacteraceae bacterium]